MTRRFFLPGSEQISSTRSFCLSLAHWANDTKARLGAWHRTTFFNTLQAVPGDPDRNTMQIVKSNTVTPNPPPFQTNTDTSSAKQFCAYKTSVNW